MFWVPREIQTMPAFTTNVEFGMFLDKRSKYKSIILGYPLDAPKMKYLHWHAERMQIPIYHTLDECILSASRNNS